MTAFNRITEEASAYRHLEKMSVSEILTNINKNSDKEKEIIEIASKYGFQLLKSNNDHKIYFAQSYIPNQFFQNDSVSLLVFHLYINSTIVG